VKILLVASRYLHHRGGLATVVHHLAQEFHSSGHEVLVVANRYPRSLPDNETIDGVSVKRLLFLYPQSRFLRQKRADLLLASFWYVWWTTCALARVIRDYEPDVVNLHYLASPGFFLWLLQPWLRFPWVVSLHGGDVRGEPYRSRFNAWLFQAAMSRADSITACSGRLAAEAIQLAPVPPGKMHVIHNGVDCERFATATPYAHPRPYVVAVGQLVPHKGFDLLINAFGDVADAFPDVDLLIAGDGECRSQLTELISLRGLARRVHLIGRVDEHTVASLMAGCLFVAVPSRREAFGIVALEGMAAGKRVLATPVGGIPEFLLPATNRMAEPGQAVWAKALADWLSLDRSVLDGAANRVWAQRLGWPQVAPQYLHACSEAISACDRDR
jgi:glycogen(starch) synthase